MNSFLRGYLECALSSSLGDDDRPLDDSYWIEDIAPESLEAAEADCATFEEAFDSQLGEYYEAGYDREHAGYDFWLTRNGHGAGFWDRGVPAGEDLTAGCDPFGSVDLYVGDDGRLYFA